MALAEPFVWDEASFLRAWEAGAFRDERVELVDGEVIRVVIGTWHGQVVMNLGHLLRHPGWRVTAATLPSSGSLPDPDVFVFRQGAAATETLGEQVAISRWRAEDVGLVVEVADSSLAYDTTVKARLYGRTGYATYWVVHRDGVEVHTEPCATGYRSRRSVGVDGAVAVPYAPGPPIAVAEVLDVST